MGKFTFENNLNGIEGLCLISPTIYKDNRGYFMEIYNKEDFAKNGINIDFVQDNYSASMYGVLRGLHRQIKFPQTKLLRVTKGRIFDVVVDLRDGSPTFLKWIGIELSEENKKQLLIPKGFAHGFLVLSEYAECHYKVDEYFHPNDESGIIWNDKTIGIDWPIPKDMELILTEKDKGWTSL